MKIAVVGGNGFVGKVLLPLLSKDFNTFPLSNQRVDITDKESIEKAVFENDSEIILNLAAYTNVDEAEKQKELGEKSISYKINAEGAENISEATRKTNKKLIHVSTDMVFGEIEKDWYHENDTPSPVNFYGFTKKEGEIKVLEKNNNSTILRIAYPYTWESENMDYARRFISFFKEKKEFSSVSDAFFAPTFIKDIASMIKIIIEKDLKGIIHGASEEKFSGYEIAEKIADKFGFDKTLLGKTSKDEFFKDKAPRAKNTSIFNDTLNDLGFKPTSFEEALDQVPESLTTGS